MARLRNWQVKRYGWIRDLPDQRDLAYAAPLSRLKKLPRSVDLRRGFPPAYDQGDLGSCTANAIAGAFQFVRRKEKLRPDFVPSRLFIYYNERVLEGTVNEDAGAMLRDGMKVCAKLGACPERSAPPRAGDWPYDPARFAVKPPAACYRVALGYQVVSYRRVAQSLAQMRGCLASGYPFVFGFTVYDGFESDEVARTGEVPLPGPGERALGGHAVVAVGYDDATQRFLVRNSWGSRWGRKGYCTMPYGYLAEPNLAADFWTIRQTE
jgi:C1A family cysteine protease